MATTLLTEQIHSGMVSAWQVHGAWTFIEWMYPGEKKFSAVKDVLRIEEKIKQLGLKGWIAKSERGHTIMHTILKKMGAAEYGCDSNNLHFMKEVK